MTEPSPQRPVPGPASPAPASPGPAGDDEAFDDLDRRPVAEHVAIFESEHARLQDELSTIDQL